MKWVRAIPASELWEGEVRPIDLEGRSLVLVRCGGAVFAYADRCPHQRVPLSRGTLSDCVLRCSAHHWEYDVRSGEGLNPKGAKLEGLPVRIEGEQILVEVDG